MASHKPVAHAAAEQGAGGEDRLEATNPAASDRDADVEQQARSRDEQAIAGDQVVIGQSTPRWQAVAGYQVIDQHGHAPMRNASATRMAGTRSSSGNVACPCSSLQKASRSSG